MVHIAILMLTHNAPDLVDLAVSSVRARTDEVSYELVVVDNGSEQPTRDLLARHHARGTIDTLVQLDENTLFAAGNNTAARHASDRATHFLLLNSDIEVRDPRWLAHLLERHERGATAYGMAVDPRRLDGYCYLIDADLYREHPLDEGHQWWWCVAKQQAQLLREGFRVAGFAEHERYLHHFGGGSGDGHKSAKGMDVSHEQLLAWFDGREAELLTDPGGFARLFQFVMERSRRPRR